VKNGRAVRGHKARDSVQRRGVAVVAVAWFLWFAAPHVCEQRFDYSAGEILRLRGGGMHMNVGLGCTLEISFGRLVAVFDKKAERDICQANEQN
jgi:hypothetical protein